MKLVRSIPIILTIAFMLVLPLNRGTAQSSTACVSALNGNGSFVDRWLDDETIDSPSVHRPADEDAPSDGIYLARYYTFRLSEAADVAITLESPIDAYLYLLEGVGMDGAVLHKNDNIDLANRNFNSRIQETLDAGEYTIEATTYDTIYPTPVVEFSLTVSGITPQSYSRLRPRLPSVALYHATNGDEWYDNTNWLSDAPLSEWFGVATDSDGRVEMLMLDDNQLSGFIPPELANLSNRKDCS